MKRREFLAFCLVAGCQKQSPLVLAASSLQPWLSQKERPFRCTFAGSHTLLAQVKSGVPAGLLLLADRLPTPAHFLTPQVFARNQLVLVRRQAPCEVRMLGPTSKLAVGDPNLAPVGRYAQAALTQLQLQPQLILTRDDRSALLTLDSGHADFAITYRSDVGQRSFCPLPSPPIEYCAYLHQKATAPLVQFYSYLLSEAGQAELRQAGFPSKTGPGPR